MGSRPYYTGQPWTRLTSFRSSKLALLKKKKTEFPVLFSLVVFDRRVFENSEFKRLCGGKPEGHFVLHSLSYPGILDLTEGPLSQL